jgi:protein-tyrosine-phosphatase/DNA-binding transcriptional ArsR family regulator
MVSKQVLPPPPAVFALAGHPLRWALLRELSRTDRQVEELAGAVGEPQNLVSYHLGRLRAAGLVTARRSSSDGRQVYYRLDLPRCATLLSEASRALHPALVPTAAPHGAGTGGAGVPRVLFVCTHNSARSQMAEAFLRSLSRETVVAASAGSEPATVHPGAVRAMTGYGLDISRQRSKHVDEFRDRRFDLVITVCDRVRERCPEFPGTPPRIHWSVPDPVDGQGAGGDAFDRVANEIRERVIFLLPVLDRPAA